MDSIIAEVTSSEFWVGVLLGNVLLVGGILYLIASANTQRPQSVRNPNDNSQDKRFQG